SHVPRAGRGGKNVVPAQLHGGDREERTWPVVSARNARIAGGARRIRWRASLSHRTAWLLAGRVPDVGVRRASRVAIRRTRHLHGRPHRPPRYDVELLR